MTYFNIVAATNENTVVTEYIPEQRTAEAYQSEAELEKEFIRRLGELGYEYLSKPCLMDTHYFRQGLLFTSIQAFHRQKAHYRGTCNKSECCEVCFYPSGGHRPQCTRSGQRTSLLSAQEHLHTVSDGG